MIGTLVRIKTTDEIGIVIERVPNDLKRWVVVGLAKAKGFRYELSIPNKYVEVLCK